MFSFAAIVERGRERDEYVDCKYIDVRASREEACSVPATGHIKVVHRAGNMIVLSGVSGHIDVPRCSEGSHPFETRRAFGSSFSFCIALPSEGREAALNHEFRKCIGCSLVTGMLFERDHPPRLSRG